MNAIHVTAVALLLTSTCATAYEDSPAAETESPDRQYTFSWRFADEGSMGPRGGSTKGEQLTLVSEPSSAWNALQAPGLSSYERDRRAILAMAGEYRASFDFIEVAGFVGAYEPSRPYQSWGTEKVYLLEDSGDRIVLQHLLVMRVVKDDGSIIGPFVTKHWRQDWQFEPTHNMAYRGKQRWDWIPIPKEQRRGVWSQLVYQVDDSPRYGGVGHWEHTGNYSSWEGGEGWRPLPRREWSIRDDYDVLVGSNRHTITPTGWVHEQQNNKVALAAPGEMRALNPIVAREFAYNRYDLIEGSDFSLGDAYVTDTEPFWAQIRQQWATRFAQLGTLQLRGIPDKDGLFRPAFDFAQSLQETVQDDTALERRACELVEDYFSDQESTCS